MQSAVLGRDGGAEEAEEDALSDSLNSSFGGSCRDDVSCFLMNTHQAAADSC